MGIRSVEYDFENYAIKEVVSDMEVSLDITANSYYSDRLRGMVYDLSTKLASNNVFEEVVHDPVVKKYTSHTISIPLTWWDHLKDTYNEYWRMNIFKVSKREIMVERVINNYHKHVYRVVHVCPHLPLRKDDLHNCINFIQKDQYMSTIVIYHKADFDGLFCREIAHKALGDKDVEYIGWDYGDIEPVCDKDDTIYILDINVPSLMDHKGVIWIDHHKTAIDRYGKLPGLQIDGVAACRLCWQYLIEGSRETLVKEMFIDRLLPEPIAVRLAGEYDIWDKRDERADTFQFGLRSVDLNSKPHGLYSYWDRLLDNGKYAACTVDELLQNGKLIQDYQTKQYAKTIKSCGFTLDWEGITFLAINTSRGYNSHLFTAALTDDHDACLGFGWDGNKWSISLYGAPHRPDIDLSQIAIKYGGGGHKQACGFQSRNLPFVLMTEQERKVQKEVNGYGCSDGGG